MARKKIERREVAEPVEEMKEAGLASANIAEEKKETAKNEAKAKRGGKK